MKPYVNSVAYLKKIEMDMQLGERCIQEDAGGLGMGVVNMIKITYMYETVYNIALEM